MDDMDEVKFINNQNGWPRWPVLPLKRRGQAGVLWGSMNQRVDPTVYLTNIFEMNFEDCEKIVYASIEEVVADGWRVD